MPIAGLDIHKKMVQAAVLDDQGETGEARELDEVGKYDEQGGDSPAGKPPSAPRQQALVTFPAPLRLNTTEPEPPGIAGGRQCEATYSPRV